LKERYGFTVNQQEGTMKAIVRKALALSNERFYLFTDVRMDGKKTVPEAMEVEGVNEASQLGPYKLVVETSPVFDRREIAEKVVAKLFPVTEYGEVDVQYQNSDEGVWT
jgi:hypothetical protein